MRLRPSGPRCSPGALILHLLREMPAPGRTPWHRAGCALCGSAPKRRCRVLPTESFSAVAWHCVRVWQGDLSSPGGSRDSFLEEVCHCHSCTDSFIGRTLRAYSETDLRKLVQQTLSRDRNSVPILMHCEKRRTKRRLPATHPPTGLSCEECPARK